jgi:hypothetical protein
MKSFYIKLILIVYIQSIALLAHAERPTLSYPDGISWESVFDSGLRPKYISGLERVMTECRDQELRVEIGDETNSLMLDKGRLSIELMHDDRVRLFEHISRVPISMAEGEHRLIRFREVFSENLVRAGTMPVIMDERTGSVMAVSDQYAVAKIGNHAFTYGFTPSFQKEVPLIPVFQLAWIRSEGEKSPPIRRETVMPPEGYEWYSLDPYVHTPDPIGISRVIGPIESNFSGGIGNPVEWESDQSEPSVREANRFRWLGLAALLLLALAGGCYWIHLRNATPSGKAT